MRLLVDYLCDEVKDSLKSLSKHLVPLATRVLPKLLYDVAINVIGNRITDLLFK